MISFRTDDQRRRKQPVVTRKSVLLFIILLSAGFTSMNVITTFFSKSPDVQRTAANTNVKFATAPTLSHTLPEPFHNWKNTKEWLCPNKVPNLTAAVATFRLAQKVGLPKSSSAPPLSEGGMERFFSHWPGHVSVRENTTNHTATFLRTFKCGSLTIQNYMSRQLKDIGHYETGLNWDGFTNGMAWNSDCMCTAFRDPMKHFFSGLGELEFKRKIQRNVEKGATRLAAYEQLEDLSEDRFISFVDFVLQGGWEVEFQHPYANYFAHVFPQSGYLVKISFVNKTMSAFVDLNNLNDLIPAVLRDSCGLPENLLPPLTGRVDHKKVPGLRNLHRRLWSNGSTSVLVSESTPRLLRSFEALCLLHAMDYACLASELNDTLPEICADTFVKFL